MNTVKLLNLAIILNGIAVVLGIISMFFGPQKHNVGSLLTSAVLFLSMMAIRASAIRQQKINAGHSNTGQL